MQDIEDFFFGKINKTEEGFYQLGLSEITKLGEMVSPDFFYSQLNRLLLNSSGFLDIYDGTSHPRFSSFLDTLFLNEIGMIQIGQRKDVNNNVKATLDCSIFLTNGIIRVTAHWCAYKEIRASEIIGSLLNPLVENKLIEKTFIKVPDNNIKPLSKDKEIATKQLFALSGYPNGSE